jgi:hypothetical protein
MSQFPPNSGQPYGGSPQQPPFGQQPVPPQYGQQPPFGQQPYGQGGYPQRPASTSGAAIGSLICGILGCIPFITSVLAIILGIVGIKATSNNRAGGRALAIIGLILGLLGVGGWSLFGGGMYALYIGSKPARAVATQFTNYMLQGDVNSAASLCDPSMSQEDLQKAADSMKTWGTLTNMTVFGAKVDNNNGVTQYELGGSAQFSNTGPKTTTFSIRKQPDGSLKIIKFNFE